MHFFLVTTLFFILVLSALLFPFLLQESFVNVFFKRILPKIASLLLFVVYYKCFLCNFLFLLQFYFCNCKCRRYFFLFLSKGFFKRFFLSQTLVFLLCLSKCFFCNFYTCCNFVFILVMSALLFPFVTERFLADFSTAFSPKSAYFCLFAAFR